MTLIYFNLGTCTLFYFAQPNKTKLPTTTATTSKKKWNLHKKNNISWNKFKKIKKNWFWFCCCCCCLVVIEWIYKRLITPTQKKMFNTLFGYVLCGVLTNGTALLCIWEYEIQQNIYIFYNVYILNCVFDRGQIKY